MFGGETKPSLSWILPDGGVELRDDCRLRAIIFQCARDQFWASRGAARMTHGVVRVVEGERAAIAEPVLQRDSGLSEVVLLEHVLVPDDELNDTEAVGEGKIDREVERRILRVERRIYGALGDGSLLAVAQDGDNNKPMFRTPRTRHTNIAREHNIDRRGGDETSGRRRGRLTDR